jgi:hypothetical protein
MFSCEKNINNICVPLTMDYLKSLGDSDLLKIKEYKIIEIPSFDHYQVNSKIFGNEYLETSLNQKKVVDSMLFYYMRHKDVDLYKRTDYICNEQEKICLCNTRAEELRRLFGATGPKCISWFQVTKNVK